jgi:hypothetical protein
MKHLPSAAEKIRAQLSVLPVIMYSPEGLQAKSYTCMVEHLTQRQTKSGQSGMLSNLNVVRGFQNSFSYWCSSAVSLPYAALCGVLDWAQIITMPSAIKDEHLDELDRYIILTVSGRGDRLS